MISHETLVTEYFAAMGSNAELVIIGESAVALAAWARGTVGALEARWSRFLDDSELNALCEQAGSGPVAASPETVDVVANALALWYVTDGLFDPTIRSSLEACGYDQTFACVEQYGPPVATPAPAPGCADLVVDRDRGTVALPAGLRIDLGGIGKGYAADLVARGLVERGARGACVALGGDVRVLGRAPDGSAWAIPIEDPLDPARVLCTRFLVDEAVVTSTTRFRRWRRGNSSMHHLIDPATGAPARRGVAAVVAQADDAWWAEGIAKAALIAGVDDGLALLERLGIAAVLVGDDSSYHYTSAWNAA